MSNCKHETAMVSHSIENLGLTQMICTWRCRQPFWMLQAGLTTKEIPNDEAVKMITGVDTTSIASESDEIIEQVEYFADCMSCENRISIWQEKTLKGNLEADDIIEAEGWWYIDGAWLCPVCQDGG